MSDFGLFESDEATQAEPRLAARTASRKLEAAVDQVRSEFGRFLIAATGIDEFEDRWHLSKHDIRASVEPLVFPNTGTMRRIKNALKQDWKLAHPYKVGLSHGEAGFGSMPEADHPKRNQHLEKTYHPSDGNLIPKGNFHEWKDSVDQDGPEKVEANDFTPGGDSGSAKNARRREAGGHSLEDRIDDAYDNRGRLVEPLVGVNPGDGIYRNHPGMIDGYDEGEYRLSPGEQALGMESWEKAYDASSDPNFVPADYLGPAGRDLGGKHRAEAARLVADIYTDFAQANGLRVASLDTLDHYAATGIAEADYRLLESMIIRQAEADCDDDDDDDKEESDDSDSESDSSDSDSDSEAPKASESDDDDDSDSEGEAPDFGGSDDSEGDDDDSDEEYDFGGDDESDEGDDFGGDDAGAGGQQFTVPEQAPELDPQVLNEIPHDDTDGSAPVPPNVIDSLLGLPEGTIEQLLLEEVQQGQGGDEFGGAPQAGGDDFLGGGGGDAEQEPPRVARRRQAAEKCSEEGCPNKATHQSHGNGYCVQHSHVARRRSAGYEDDIDGGWDRHVEERLAPKSFGGESHNGTPVHTFSSTGQAYDECQFNEDINDGDILHIPSEGVVGMAGTWPAAVTKANGNLHGLKDHIHADPTSLDDGESEFGSQHYHNATDYAHKNGYETHQHPGRTARKFRAAPDESEAELMGRQRSQQRDAIDTKFGPAPEAKPNIQELYARAQNGDRDAYGQLKGLYQQRGWTAARRFWAADDDQDSGGGDSGGQQPPQGDPAQAGGDPSAMGGQPMMPPPGSQAVAPPQPAQPLENQPAEDALLDTANAAIMQMIDRETQEYQQIIGPLSQALQAVQFAQQVEQAEHPMDVTPPQGTVNVDPSQAPGGAQNPQQQLAHLMRQAGGQGPEVSAPWADSWEHMTPTIKVAPGTPPEEALALAREHRRMKGPQTLEHRPVDGMDDRRLSFESRKKAVLRNAAKLIAKTHGVSERMLVEALSRRNYEHLAEAFLILPPPMRQTPEVRAAANHVGKMLAADNQMFNFDHWMDYTVGGSASGSRLPFDSARVAGIREASDPRDRAWDAWASGRDRGVAEHGRHDLDDDDYGDEYRGDGSLGEHLYGPKNEDQYWDDYMRGDLNETADEQPHVPDYIELPSQQYATGIDPDMLRRMKPHEYLSMVRSAGETLKNTPTMDRFEFPNEQPEITDNMTINDLPKQTFKSLPKMKASQERLGWGTKGVAPKVPKLPSEKRGDDVMGKYQRYTDQRTQRGLNFGDNDVTVEDFLNEKHVGSEAGGKLHDQLGISHPPVNPGMPAKIKPTVPKAKNPAIKRGTWGEWEPTREASFFTRKVPGWRWDDHLNGYISKEAKPFSCSCGQKVAAPSYKSCDCGKIWNVYAIGDTHHLASDTADMFIAREIPVRDNVIMANKKLAGFPSDGFDDPDECSVCGGHVDETGECTNCGLDDRGRRNNDKYGPHGPGVGYHPHRRSTKTAKDGECTCWEGYERVPGTEPCASGSCRKKTKKKSSRELLAEIERLADWTKYDDDVDPAVEAYGKNKVPSTSVSQPPKDWAKRKPAGDPGKKGGTWTPPTIPRKKK